MIDGIYILMTFSVQDTQDQEKCRLCKVNVLHIPKFHHLGTRSRRGKSHGWSASDLGRFVIRICSGHCESERKVQLRVKSMCMLAVLGCIALAV